MARDSKGRSTARSKSKTASKSRASSRTKTASKNTASRASKTTSKSKAVEASPTGKENVAGTAQAQLSQAPPMADPSGSNIPAPNLRQPVLDEALPEARTGDPASLDPNLTDPETAARERVAGRTSDAATRDADVLHSEVLPDLSDGLKSSDAGPDQYPFPPQGDVEVLTVDPGNGKGEFFPNLEIEDYVILDGDHDMVPDRLDGRRAVVTDAPRYLIPMDKKDETWITVRTRDEVNATLHIPLSATKGIEKGGKSPTVRG